MGLQEKEKCSEQQRMTKRFNIRVYGIVVNDRNELLVSDELVKGMQFTKFPGGGLEWGEGTQDCLVREFREELLPLLFGCVQNKDCEGRHTSNLSNLCNNVSWREREVDECNYWNLHDIFPFKIV